MTYHSQSKIALLSILLSSKMATNFKSLAADKPKSKKFYFDCFKQAVAFFDKLQSLANTQTKQDYLQKSLETTLLFTVK